MPVTRTRSASRQASQTKLQFPPGTTSASGSNLGLGATSKSTRVGPPGREVARSSSSKNLATRKPPNEPPIPRISGRIMVERRPRPKPLSDGGGSTEIEFASSTDTDDLPAVEKKSSKTSGLKTSKTEGKTPGPSGTERRPYKDKGKDPRPIICSSEVLEISSDEDEEVFPPYSAKGVRNEMARLNKELEEIKADSKRLRRENVELKLKHTDSNNQLAKDLEDDVTCEVCSMPMWEPCLLTQCGHTFCVTCVDDWFKRTLDQHIARFPDYRLQAGQPAIQYQFAGGQLHDYEPLPGGFYSLHDLQLYQPNLAARLGVRPGGQYAQRPQAHMHHAAVANNNHPKPEYTCPSCRTVVKTRPAEDFTLKKVVRAVVAAASGQSSPKSKSKKRAVSGSAVWDRYFGQ